MVVVVSAAEMVIFAEATSEKSKGRARRAYDIYDP